MAELNGVPGVWCFITTNYNEEITEVFPDEIDALRKVNDSGYGKAKFVPFGVSLVDLAVEERIAQKTRNEAGHAQEVL